MEPLKGKKKIVLPGSGTKYPCFIGALSRLLEEDIEITEICGTSGGAIIAAGFANAYHRSHPEKVIEYLEELVSETLPGPLLDPRWITFPWGVNGLFKGKKILKTLRKELPKNFNQLKIPAHIATFDVNTGRHQMWNLDNPAELPLTVRASLSLPFIFDPVKIKGHLHTDGGATKNLPLDVFGKGCGVIGMTFQKDEPVYQKIDNKIDFGIAHVRGMIASAMMEDVEDATKASVCYIDTKHGSLDLFQDKNDVREQIKDGYDSMARFLKKNNL